MAKFRKYGRVWYTTWAEAQSARRYGERVYYDQEMRAYYIIRPQKRSFWSW